MNEIDVLNRKIAALHKLIELKDMHVQQCHIALEKVINSFDNSKKEDIIKIQKDLGRCLEIDFEYDLIKTHFEEIHPNFYSEFRRYSSSITTKDERLASFIIMGLNNKEIAFLTNVTHGGIKKSVQRLKKKLNLAPEQSLRRFIHSIAD